MKKVKSILAVKLAALLCACGFAFSAWAEQNFYKDSADANLWHIANLTGLKEFRDSVNGGEKYTGKTIQLDADIDLSLDVDANSQRISWVPVGTTDNPFSGTFDGDGHTISGLVLSGPVTGTQLGLFGVIVGTANTNYTTIGDVWVNGAFVETNVAEANYTAVVKNLVLANVSVSNSSEDSATRYTGALAGQVRDGYVANIVVSGSVTGIKGVGGVVGSLDGSIAKCCTNSATIVATIGGYNVGGIAGGTNYKNNDNRNSAFVNCANSGAITTTKAGGYAGGIVGLAQNGSNGIIIGCTNSGTIHSVGANSGLGGIAGRGNMATIISGCANSGTITAEAEVGNVGGIAGESISDIYNCTNTANITISARSLCGIYTYDSHNGGDNGLIYNCVNEGTLVNTSSSPSATTSQLSDCAKTAVYANQVFADVVAVNAAMAAASGMKFIEFQNCTVTDKSGTLILASSVRGVSSDAQLCTTVDVSTGNDSILTVDVPNVSITVAANYAGDLRVSGASNVVAVNAGVAVSGLVVSGAGSTVTNNGTVARLELGGTGAVDATNNGTLGKLGFADTGTYTVVNNGTISHTQTSPGSDHTVSTIRASNITIDNYGKIEAKEDANGGCSYALLFYNGSTVVINCYKDSVIQCELGGLFLACQSANSVTFNVQEGASFNNGSASITPSGSNVTVQPMAAPVAQIISATGATTNKYESLAQAIKDVQAGETIQLLSNVTWDGTAEDPAAGSTSYYNLTAAGNVTIDGKGYTLFGAGATPTDSAIMLGDSSWDAPTGAGYVYTITNMTFSGFSSVDHGALRAQGVTANVIGCTFTDNASSPGWGVVSSSHANLNVKDCVFSGTTSGKCIDFGSNGNNANDITLSVDNCRFNNNQLNGSGVIYVAGSIAAATIGDCSFSGNAVASDGAAVVYCSGTTEVTGCLFMNNTVTVTGSGNKCGVLALGSGATNSVFTGNAFDSNTVTYNDGNKATVYVGATNVDLAGNYWGGSAPTVGNGSDIYVASGKSATYATYATAYTTNANGRGVTVTLYVPQVARIGGTTYATLEAAIDAAQSGDTIEILDGTWGADAIGTLEKLSNRDKSLTIQAASGASPKFTSIVKLGYDDSSTRNATITVKGLAFENAQLQIGNYAQTTVEDCSFVGSGDQAALRIIESCAVNYNRTDFIEDQVTVRNCTFNGTKNGVPAIRLRDSGNVLITGNTIANSNHNGILLESDTEHNRVNTQVSKTVVIQNNTITEWNAGNVSDGGRGIRASLGTMAAGSTVTISGNTFRKETTGLDSPDFAKITGVGSGNTVDLSGNDWNDMLLSEVLSSGNAIYTCDVTPTLTSVITTKFEPVAKIGSTAYGSLKAAVEAAQADDTITLLADDNVSLTDGSEIEINKSLTITGATAANGEPLYTIYGKNTVTGYNDIFITGNGTVTISNVKIAQFGNNAATDIRHAPVYVSTSFTGTVNLDNVYISKFNRGGLFLYGGTFNVTDCYIDCANARSGAFTKGIEINGSATGTISDTVIVNMERSSTTFSSAGVEIYGSGSVVVDGCTILSNDGNHASVKATYGIVVGSVGDHNPAGGSLTVTDTMISSSNGSLSVDAANYHVELSECSFDNYIVTWSNGSDISVSSGEYAEDVYAYAGSITITGGVFTNFLPDSGTGTIAISGGLFDAEVPTKYLAEGYECVENTDSETSEAYHYTVREAVAYVAQIGDTKYETLDAAIAAAEDGETVTMLADVALTEMLIVPNGKNITLDLADCMISADENTWTSGDMLICVAYGATLTLEDSVENGMGWIDATTNDGLLGAIKMTNKGDDPTNGTATLIVKGGIIEGTYYGISGNGTRHGTSVTIEGGWICADDEAEGIGIYQPQNGTLVIRGDEDTQITAATAVYVKSGSVSISGEVQLWGLCDATDYSANGNGANPTGEALVIDNCGYPGGAPVVSIMGGFFHGGGENDTLANAIGSYASGEGNEAIAGFVSGGRFYGRTVPAEFCADGYLPGTEADDEDSYSVRPANYVAQIVGGAKFESLADAFAAVVDGDTITMLANSTESGEPVLARNICVTLDLNGKTVTANGDIWVKTGSLTVVGSAGSAINSTGYAFYVSTQSIPNNVATLTINSNDVTIHGDGYGIAVMSGGVVNLQAGSVTSTANAAICNNGSNEANTTINITGGTVSSDSTAIYHPGPGTLTVGLSSCDGDDGHSHPVIAGKTGVEMRAGTLNVYCGDITATATEFAENANGSGPTIAGAAIAVSQHTTDKMISVNISGGVLNGIYGVYEKDLQNPDTGSDVEIVVTGGEISGTTSSIVISDIDSTTESVSAAISGGYFSSKVPQSYLAEGKLCTTKANFDHLYQVVDKCTVTFNKGTTELVVTLPGTINYPAGDLAKRPLPDPTYTSENTTFAGWQMTVDNETKIVSELPAGTTGNVELTATWTTATPVTVDATTTTGNDVIALKVTDTWLQANQITTGTSESDVVARKAALEAEDATTGLKKWQNYVLGQDTTKSASVVAAKDSVEETKAELDMTFNVPAVDTGFDVKYRVDKVVGETVTEGAVNSVAEIDLAAATTSQASAFFQVKAVLTPKGSTDSTKDVVVDVQKTVGVVKVDSAAEWTIVAVPWESLGDGDIKASELIHLGNRSNGDELRVYQSGTYQTYELVNGEWTGDAAQFTANNDNTSSQQDPQAANVVTIPRGAGVWLKRVDPTAPIYLLGQKPTSETQVTTTLEKPDSEAAEGTKAWNLVASPSLAEVDVATLLQGNETTDKIIVPTEGAPKNYTWDGTNWGYESGEVAQETYTNSRGVQITIFRPVRKTDDNKIPAATGFWYLNGDKTTPDKKINW